MKVQEDKQCCSVICLTKGSDSVDLYCNVVKFRISRIA